VIIFQPQHFRCFIAASSLTMVRVTLFASRSYHTPDAAMTTISASNVAKLSARRTPTFKFENDMLFPSKKS